MGDRITTYHPCPQCHRQMETYDALSSLMYVSQCEHCGYKDRREYFEVGRNEIRLITPEQLEELKKKDPKVKKFRKWLENLDKKQEIGSR